MGENHQTAESTGAPRASRTGRTAASPVEPDCTAPAPRVERWAHDRATPRQHAQRRISARIGAIAESATLAVDAKAKALKAAGRPVIGFGAGEPDFPTPDYIVEAAVDGLPRPGEPPLHPGRRAARSSRRRSPTRPRATAATRSTPAQVLVTNGGKQAVYEAFATLLDPGDEVLAARAVLDDLPRGDPAGRRRRRSRCSPTRPRTTWSPSSSSRRPAPTAPRCCCSARRPTRPARSTRREQVEAIGRWAARARPLGGHRRDLRAPDVRRRRGRARCRSPCPSWPTRCVVVNGVAKTYAMTGWRVGWLIGPADVVKAATNLQSHATSNVANVSQRAALAAVTGRPVRGRRDEGRPSTGGAGRSSSMLNEIDGVVCPSRRARSTPTRRSRACSAGSTTARTADRRSAELAELILEEAEVAVVPGEAFGTPGLPPAVLRARRRRPGRGRQPAAEALRLSGRWLGRRRPRRDLRRCRRRTCTCTSPGRCGTRRCSSWPSATASCCPTRWSSEWPPQLSAADEKGWFRFQRLYDVARSVLRTEDDVRRLVREAAEDDAARRRPLAGAPGRPERRTPPASAASPAFTELVLDAVARRPRRDRASGSASSSPPTAPGTRSTRAPWPGSRRSTPAAAWSASGSPTTSAAARTADFAPAFAHRRAGRAAAGPARRRAARARQSCGQRVDELHADRLGHGVRSVEDPALLDRVVDARHRARGLPGLQRRARRLLRPHLGAAARRCSRPAPRVALGADDPLLFGSRLAGQYATMRAAHDLSDDDLAELAAMSVQASCAPDAVEGRSRDEIDAGCARRRVCHHVAMSADQPAGRTRRSRARRPPPAAGPTPSRPRPAARGSPRPPQTRYQPPHGQPPPPGSSSTRRTRRTYAAAGATAGLRRSRCPDHPSATTALVARHRRPGRHALCGGITLVSPVRVGDRQEGRARDRRARAVARRPGTGPGRL